MESWRMVFGRVARFLKKYLKIWLQFSFKIDDLDSNDEVAPTNITQRSKNNAGLIRRLYEGSDIRVCEDCGRKGDKWEIEEHPCREYKL